MFNWNTRMETTGAPASPGIGLLEQFARDKRIRIRRPKRNMQTKIVRPLSNGNDFVAYVDAIGNWTVRGDCSNGKPPALVIRTSLKG